jgi:hypothetical protein
MAGNSSLLPTPAAQPLYSTKVGGGSSAKVHTSDYLIQLGKLIRLPLQTTHSVTKASFVTMLLTYLEILIFERNIL